jgi:hypothetical protein
MGSSCFSGSFPPAITLIDTSVCFGFFVLKRASRSFSTGSEISGAVSKLSWVVAVSGVGRSCSGVAGLHELSNSKGAKLVLARVGSVPMKLLDRGLSSSEDESLGGSKNPNRPFVVLFLGDLAS